MNFGTFYENDEKVVRPFLSKRVRTVLTLALGLVVFLIGPLFFALSPSRNATKPVRKIAIITQFKANADLITTSLTTFGVSAPVEYFHSCNHLLVRPDAGTKSIYIMQAPFDPQVGQACVRALFELGVPSSKICVFGLFTKEELGWNYGSLGITCLHEFSSAHETLPKAVELLLK